MSVSRLTESAQNYLKAVWTLQEWSDEPVTASTVAERVGVRLSTASGAISKLTEQGLLDHTPYGAVTLTARGRHDAIMMVRRHRLIESFLVQTLGYRWDQVHDEAERLEHAVSDFLVERIDAVLGHPARDPHGDPIPSPDGEITIPSAAPLTTASPGEQVVVERISDADGALLQFFADRGITVGTVLEVVESEPYSEVVQVRPEGSDATAGTGSADDLETVSLGRAAAEAVWVAAQP